MSAPRRTLAALGVLSLLAIAGCTSTTTSPPTPPPAPSSGPPTASPSPTPTPTPTPSPTPTPTPTPTPSWLSPLDGMPGKGARPVLVVKLDNTRFAQPHAGLTRADVVYVEEVEYGITRLAAVFSQSVPRRIGPVRSARITDIDLLSQYDRPAFAYSGAQRKMYPYLDGARFHDVSPRTGGAGYSRDYNRPAPYNYYLDGHVAQARAPKATPAHDMGFVFDERAPEGGRTATKADMAWGYSSAGFDYKPKQGRYDVRFNGLKAQAEESKRGQSASTVVIQYVKQAPSKFFDKGGGNTPHAETIGKGKAIVLRDGRAWNTTWRRPSAEDGTTFTLKDGSEMPFKPGQVWIVLLDRNRKATVTPLTKPKPTPTATETTRGWPRPSVAPTTRAATPSPGRSASGSPRAQ